MVNNHTKRCSTAFLIKRMEFKYDGSYFKNLTISNGDKNVEQLELSYVIGNTKLCGVWRQGEGEAGCGGWKIV